MNVLNDLKEANEALSVCTPATRLRRLTNFFDAAKATVEAFDRGEVVEGVLCRDCKKYECRECPMSHSDGTFAGDDGFCNYGERKEGAK